MGVDPRVTNENGVVALEASDNEVVDMKIEMPKLTFDGLNFGVPIKPKFLLRSASIGLAMLLVAEILYAQGGSTGSISRHEKILDELLSGNCGIHPVATYPKHGAVTINSHGILTITLSYPNEGTFVKDFPLKRLDLQGSKIRPSKKGDHAEVVLRCMGKDCIFANIPNFRDMTLTVASICFKTEGDAKIGLHEIESAVAYFSNSNSPSLVSQEKPAKERPPALVQSVKISQGNRPVDRFSTLYLENGNTIVAVWAINKNWNKEWIFTGALSDVVDILKGISKSGVSYGRVSLSGTYGLDDIYGNKEETEVLRMTFSRQTVQRINWDNFRQKNVLNIADEVYMHPSWQE